MPSPVIPFTIAIATTVFVALLYGDQLPQVTLAAPSQASADCSGIFTGFGCLVQYVIHFFQVIYQVLNLLLSVLFFQVQGAPWYVQLLVTITIGGNVLIGCIYLLRGVD